MGCTEIVESSFLLKFFSILFLDIESQGLRASYSILKIPIAFDFNVFT